MSLTTPALWVERNIKMYIADDHSCLQGWSLLLFWRLNESFNKSERQNVVTSIFKFISELIITSVGQSVIHFIICLVDEKGNSSPVKKSCVVVRSIRIGYFFGTWKTRMNESIAFAKSKAWFDVCFVLFHQQVFSKKISVASKPNSERIPFSSQY